MRRQKPFSQNLDFVKTGAGIGSSALKITKGILKAIPLSTAINRAIDALPIELHLPGGYRFCGPGTKLKERLSRGDTGINQLDEACKLHDIDYSKYSDSERRLIADRALAEKAWQRVTSGDASLGERAASLAVAAAMKAKTAIGGGRRRNRTPKIKRGGGKRRRSGKVCKRKRKTTSKNGRGLYLRPYSRNVY